MAVDKNLFLYDLAIVAIMKCEAPYIKEWLDYHLLAGVDHFYIYDNDSPDNQKEVLQPYIDAGLVTYTFFPGPSAQFPAYNDALNRFRFLCRYIAFIDADEFIFPQSNRSIIEVVDEILADKPNAGGLCLNWHIFGSSGHKTADYSRGVLERFVYRAPKDYDFTIKNIVDPRKIRYFGSPHYMMYFEDFFAVNEEGDAISPGLGRNEPATDKKIVLNHYVTKSYEEYMSKKQRGSAVYTIETRSDEIFNEIDEASNIFDDSILKYRAERQAAQIPMGGGIGNNILATLAPCKQIDSVKVYGALMRNLATTLPLNVSLDFFQGKLETFLTCRALSAYLNGKILNEKTSKFFEEAALNAAYKTLFTPLQVADIWLVLSEFTNILPLDYPIVKVICEACAQILSDALHGIRSNVSDHMPKLWEEYFHLEEHMKLLKAVSKRDKNKC